MLSANTDSVRAPPVVHSLKERNRDGYGYGREEFRLEPPKRRKGVDNATPECFPLRRKDRPAEERLADSQESRRFTGPKVYDFGTVLSVLPPHSSAAKPEGGSPERRRVALAALR